MKVRVGEGGSRFTPDLDASRIRTLSLDEYLAQLDDRLVEGWAGFTGTVTTVPPPQPDDYIMQPFDIQLEYRSRRWLTVRFELGRDEVGSTDEVEEVIADDILELFAIIGLPEPQPLPVLALQHQIVQKLHACTAINPKTGRNERAHDLVDLQPSEGVDVYLLGLVVVATLPGRFWLGFTLVIVPLLIGPLGRAFGGVRPGATRSPLSLGARATYRRTTNTGKAAHHEPLDLGLQRLLAPTWARAAARPTRSA